MSFTSGSVSFRTFSVVGQSPAMPNQELLNKLQEFAFTSSELGVPDEVEYGWSGARHLMDRDSSFGSMVFGEAMHFALLVQTNKVPGDVKKAMLAKEEEAAAASNPSGFISKVQRRQCKDTVARQCDALVREGRYKKQRIVPVLWDLSKSRVYTAASGTTLDFLHEIFERTFGLELAGETAGVLASRFSESLGDRRRYEDCRPTAFVAIAPDGSAPNPDYPWVAGGPQPRDFLGNEFVRWLLHQDDLIRTKSGKVEFVFDRRLELECPFGMRGREQYRGYNPARSPECLASLQEGKVPRRATILVEGYEITLNPERMAFTGVKLLEVEDAESPRVLFEERIKMLDALVRTVGEMFDAFLRVRLSEQWGDVVSEIIAAGMPAVAA